MTTHPATALTIRLARAVLGVKASADGATIRRAFREHAKRLHPDRDGGDAAKFREMLEAYRLVQAAAARAAKLAELSEPQNFYMPPATRPQPLYRPIVHIDANDAMLGGTKEVDLVNGRRIRITLPPGMRPGDLIRAGGETFRMVFRSDDDTIVRGSDLWITAKVSPQVLRSGGRVALTTPIGRRIVWISKKALDRRLVRVEGQGLPARGDYPSGHLFVRLAPEVEVFESRARQLLRKFVEAWAA